MTKANSRGQGVGRSPCALQYKLDTSGVWPKWMKVMGLELNSLGDFFSFFCKLTGQRACQMAQKAKNLPAMWETWV